VNRRILALAAVHGTLALLVVSLSPALSGARTTPLEVAGFAVVFALAGSLPIHVEHRRGSLAVVLDEAVWVVGLFALTPAGLVAAAVAGDALSRIVARQVPLKMVYNLATTFLAAAVGASLFAAIGLRDPGAPASWVAAMAAMAALSGTSLVCISLVLALVEGRRLPDVLRQSAPGQAVATAANASVGLATAVLLHTSAAGPLILAPIVATVVVASRRQTVQAAEHLRFERLYAAAARTDELAGFEEALAALATEARSLVTGSVALCCAARADGEWAGVQVDDAGSVPAERAAVDALAALSRSGETRTVSRAELPPAVRDVLPPGVDVVVAVPAPPARADVVLAVFREIAPDGQQAGRREVLGAFAGHAALTVANALLYEEVAAALQREIDLNRQKSEFVAAVSHELRTPLTTVIGAVSTIHRLGARLDAEQQHKLLSRAIDQGGRLRRLIDELLLVAATEHSGLQADLAPADVGRIVEDAITALADRSGGWVRFDRGPSLPVLTDGEKIRRIVSNLVENALKYAPDGPIDVRAERAGSGVVVSVTDHGPGIEPADRQRVFEPFVQLDQSSTRRQGGTGLGLHLCRQLAELLGGRLDLDETPGGGCRFTLAIPDPPGPSEPSDARPVAAPVPS
jgi:signal transduction histidine kinase